MSSVDWYSVIKDVMGVGIPVLTFLLGKLTKGATNQIQLDHASMELKELQAAVLSHTGTLASHTTLHMGYAISFQRIEDTLQEMNRLLGMLDGKMTMLTNGRH